MVRLVPNVMVGLSLNHLHRKSDEEHSSEKPQGKCHAKRDRVICEEWSRLQPFSPTVGCQSCLRRSRDCGG